MSSNSSHYTDIDRVIPEVLAQDPNTTFPSDEDEGSSSPIKARALPLNAPKLKRSDGPLLSSPPKYRPKRQKVKSEPATQPAAKPAASKAKFNRYDLFKEFAEQNAEKAALKSIQPLFAKFEEKEVAEFKVKLSSGEANLDEQIVHFGKFKGQRYVDLWNDTTPTDQYGSCGRSYLNYCKKLGILYGQSVAIVEVLQEKEAAT